MHCPSKPKKPYVVLRKTYKPYMGDAIKAETLSITTGQPQTLILDEKDRDLLKGKKAVIIWTMSSALVRPCRACA